MSTTSWATASGRDHVPSDESNLKSRMCLFVVTWKDGTPLDATSVTKEDIVKMCIKMGHTHPLGVLHYPVMESVALFCSTEEMQCATHKAIKAMELWGEAIAVRAVAPSVTHVKAYIMTVHGDHSKPNLHPQKRRENPTHHMITPTQVGKLCIISKQSLTTLLIMNCISLWRISVRRLHSMSWTCPPEALHQCLGDTHQGARMPKRVTRRSHFWEGEGRFPQDNHPHLLPLHDQMEDGFLRDHLHHPNLLLNQIQAWGTYKYSGIGFMIGYP